MLEILIGFIAFLLLSIIVVFLYCAIKIKRGEYNMENNKRIYEMSLIELVLLATETQDQDLKNRIVLEITYRNYIPFQGKTFEEMLVENGYRIIDKEKGKNK